MITTKELAIVISGGLQIIVKDLNYLIEAEQEINIVEKDFMSKLGIQTILCGHCVVAIPETEDTIQAIMCAKCNKAICVPCYQKKTDCKPPYTEGIVFKQPSDNHCSEELPPICDGCLKGICDGCHEVRMVDRTCAESGKIVEDEDREENLSAECPKHNLKYRTSVISGEKFCVECELEKTAKQCEACQAPSLLSNPLIKCIQCHKWFCKNHLIGDIYFICLDCNAKNRKK